MKVAAAALAGCILLAGGTGSAYAANVGGIQRTVQVWLHGDQTTANMTVSDDGTYTIEYPDENGETREISGGGIAYEADGTERPLTGEELLEKRTARMWNITTTERYGCIIRIRRSRSRTSSKTMYAM